MELRTGKKENVMRIWRLRFSLRSVLKFWTLVLYSLVDRSPVTVCHAPLHQNSEVPSIKVMSYTVFAFRLILLGILNGEGLTSSQTWHVMQGSTNFPKLLEPPANLGPKMVASILRTHSFGLSYRVETESDSTRRSTGGEVKGKEANGVGSQHSCTVWKHGLSSITNADAHTSAASSRLNWQPRRYKWTRPFRWKTKSGFCACAITFRFHSTTDEFK